MGISAMKEGSESAHFAASMLSALYGPESPQLKQFQAGQAAAQKVTDNHQGLGYAINQHARGAIQNTVAELQAGLIVRLRTAVAGEILSELIRLAKETMVDHTEAAKNVAAVLSASAYEGLIRRMGEEFAGIADRPKLEEVIGALKAANILKGGEIGVALSYLKFRNDSLHADWNNVQRSQVESCLAFSESLLLNHFGS